MSHASIPSVTIITPTTPDRQHFMERLRSCVFSQDYKKIRWLISDDSTKIGKKRNALCSQADTDIILMMDSDDYYAHDYVSKSVEHLISKEADVTGLSKVYFYQPHVNMWEYEWKGRQPYVVESGMCFWKKTWERSKFCEVHDTGEGIAFLTNAGNIVPHNYTEGMLAIIHNSNTSSRSQLGTMKRLHPSFAVSILGDNYDMYSPI